MAEPPLQACADTGATIVPEPALKQAVPHRSSNQDSHDDDDDHNNNNNNSDDDEDHPHNSSVRVKRPSYRILGTHSSLPHESDDDGEEEDDPMAWADLEAFGGTRKTLAKKRPARKLTPDEVREQLAELHEIERRMQDAQREKRSKKGMIDTIAWLKKHNEAIEAAGANQKMKRSSSFVRSVLNFFSSGSRSRTSSDDAHATANSNNNPHSHHTTDASIDNNAELSSSVFDDEYENFPKLEAPWGQHELNCSWPRLGFALLNQSIRYDIARVRAVIAQGGLGGATPQAIVAVAKWLTLFDQHVHDVITLKEYLLEERTVVAGVGYKVTTIYDSYNESLATALSKVHEDRRYLGDAIEHMFAELEAILEDEAAAVADVIATSLTETQEYDALSCLFHHLSDEEGCGVIVAKLLGWMKLHFDERDVKAFLAVFDHDMQDRIAGDWMRQYASYLHLLDEFAVHAETPMTFFT